MFTSKAKQSSYHCEDLSYQHADVHGQVDFSPAAVIRTRSQTSYDSLSFTDVTRCMVGMDILQTLK